jgi:hypothetical protein
MGMPHSKRWVPKLKVKAVSFVVPLISVVWPFEGEEGAADADRLLLNSGTEAGKQEALVFHAGAGSPTKLMAPKVIVGAGSSAGSLCTVGSPLGPLLSWSLTKAPSNGQKSMDLRR